MTLEVVCPFAAEAGVYHGSAVWGEVASSTGCHRGYIDDSNVSLLIVLTPKYTDDKNDNLINCSDSILHW